MIVKTHTEVDRFIASLEELTRAKVLRAMNLLEKFGFQLTMPHSKKISGQLFELRIRGGQEVRIFYCFYQSQAFLLHGFVKKTEKTPTRGLETAIERVRILTKV